MNPHFLAQHLHTSQPKSRRHKDRPVRSPHDKGWDRGHHSGLQEGMFCMPASKRFRNTGFEGAGSVERPQSSNPGTDERILWEDNRGIGSFDLQV